MPPSSERVRAAVVIAALALTIGLVFAPALGGPFHAYDDATYILGNRLVTAPGDQPLLDMLLTPTVGYVVPLTVGTQALLYSAGGGSALPFHLAALLLHVGVVLLIWWLARRSGADALLAAALAALFALHPLVVEPVAWATGLKDLLMAAAALGACAMFLAGRSWGVVALSLCAVLAKPTAALLPLALLFGAWLRSERVGSAKPLWVAAALALMVGLLSKISHDVVIADPARVPGGPLSALLALGYQTAHVAWPAALHPQYLIDRSAGFADAHAWLGLGALLGVGLFVVWCARVARRRRDDRRWLTPMFGALALLSYLPVSHLLAFPRYVADSYLYLPLAALLLAATPWLSACARRGRRARAAVIGVLLALAAAAAWRSVGQVERWRSARALWGPLAAARGDDARPWLLLAQGLYFAGDAASAASAYGQAFARQRRPRRLTNYARALFAARKLADAECLIIEDAVYGAAQRRALANLALLLAKHRDYRPRWRRAGQAALAATLADRRLRWPAALVESARRRLALLGGAPAQGAAALPTAATWPAGRCAALRRRRIDFAAWQKR